jgi:hypothetical protein
MLSNTQSRMLIARHMFVVYMCNLLWGIGGVNKYPDRDFRCMLSLAQSASPEAVSCCTYLFSSVIVQDYEINPAIIMVLHIPNKSDGT